MPAVGPTAATPGQLVTLVRRRARVDAGRAVADEHDRERTAAARDAAQLVTTERARAGGDRAGYDAAGRLLRDWYLQVRAAGFANGLGQQAIIPGSVAVEDLTVQLRRVRPAAEPMAALRTVAVLWRFGQEDANAAVVAARQRLVDQAPYRAARDAGQAGVNATRTGILRHWYQRCYLAEVDAELGLLPPIRAVTDAEARQVAEAVQTQQHRRLIDADGVPLVTAQGTVMSEVDRRLAGGEVDVLLSPVTVADQLLQNRTLEHRVVTGWNFHPARRSRWAAAAGIEPAAADRSWLVLTTGDQAKLIGAWLDDHAGARLRPFGVGVRIEKAILAPAEPTRYDPADHLIPSPSGDGETAAAAMFNHPEHPPGIRTLSAISSTAVRTAEPATGRSADRGHDSVRPRQPPRNVEFER